MSKYKTISVSEDTFTEFERMAKNYKLSNKGLIEAMLLYFKVSKADPRNPEADNPTDAIKALDRRLITFIKEQEKKLLLPMKDAIFEMASTEGMPRREDLRIVNGNVKMIITHLNIK